MSATQLWESTEKQVNEIEIRLFLQDSIALSQLAALDALGGLCPNDYGEAVLRARVLYNRFEEKEFAPTCANFREESEERENRNAPQTTLHLSPNPSTGIVSIPNLHGRIRTIQAFDLAGRLFHQVSTSDTEIDLNHLANGAYLLRITDKDSGKTEVAKLILHR